jgi:hypothetical protein
MAYLQALRRIIAERGSHNIVYVDPASSPMSAVAMAGANAAKRFMATTPATADREPA